jgi:hypothetical protein
VGKDDLRNALDKLQRERISCLELTICRELRVPAFSIHYTLICRNIRVERGYSVDRSQRKQQSLYEIHRGGALDSRRTGRMQ